MPKKKKTSIRANAKFPNRSIEQDVLESKTRVNNPAVGLATFQTGPPVTSRNTSAYVRAFHDTWEPGIHSCLSYPRNRRLAISNFGHA
ncbi:MAG: hypothetical protein WCA94_03050 [Candidatus Acidiferrum sp.]